MLFIFLATVGQTARQTSVNLVLIDAPGNTDSGHVHVPVWNIHSAVSLFYCSYAASRFPRKISKLPCKLQRSQGRETHGQRGETVSDVSITKENMSPQFSFYPASRQWFRWIFQVRSREGHRREFFQPMRLTRRAILGRSVEKGNNNCNKQTAESCVHRAGLDKWLITRIFQPASRYTVSIHRRKSGHMY